MGTVSFTPDTTPQIQFSADPAPADDSGGDVFSEGGAQAAAAGTEDINPVVGGAEALAHAATANTIGLAGPAVGGARYWAGRLTGESAEEARQRGDEMSAAIAPYTIYQPATKSGKAVTEAAGNAIMAPANAVANAAEAPLSDAARQSVEEALGDVNRTAAIAPVLGLTPGGAAAGPGGANDTAPPRAPVDAAREAAHAPAPPPDSAGPNPAHYAPQPPKPKITPKAGESAQAAAARQGIQTPPPEPTAQPAAPAAAPPAAAAPDRAGNPAPDVHDPGFFPAPDNLGAKSGPVAPEQQVARQAAVERGAPTLPQVRDSAITNDYNDQGRDWTGRQAGDPAAVAQTATEAAALHNEAGRISAETGGQQGTGEAADRVRGQAYQDWHDTTTDALDKHISAAYAAEDTAAKQIASPGSNLKGVLTNDSLIDSADASHVRNSVVALGKSMGVDLTDPNSTMNAFQIEQLRKHANSVYGNAPRFAQAVKNAADADLPSGAYVNARKLRQVKADMFENRDGINQLGQSTDKDPATGRPRPENRPVKVPDVMKKIEGMDPGQVQHIHNTMKRSASVLEALGDHDTAVKVGDKAYKAAQQMQSHFTSRWIDEAEKGGGWNTRRANQFLRGNQESLNAVLSPEQMHQIRNVSEAANVLDLDKGYKGAFAQFRTGASWIRKKLGRTAEGLITDALPFGNTIGELSGGPEHLRNLLGGTNKAEAPKNFTRPLGATIAGGKQRGAIGDLTRAKLPAVEHNYDPATREHTVTSANGQTQARQRGNDVQIFDTKTNPEATGKGEATARAVALADRAHSQGGNLISDTQVSPSAAKVYPALKHLGYDVKKNPNVSESSSGILRSTDTRPVFTVGPRKAPEGTPGQLLFGGKQRGGPKFSPKAETPTEGAPFKQWFGKSKVVDPMGNPLKVYHGTTKDFSSFDTEHASPENDFGAGIYFTNDKDDVTHNYAGRGPDLDNKIEYRKEQLIGEGKESGEAETQAIAEHMSHQGAVIPAHLRMENPVELGGKNETRFTHEFEYEDDDPEKDIIGEKGTLPEFTAALREAAVGSGKYDDVDDSKLDDAIQQMHEYGDGLKISDAIKILHDNEGAISYANDEKGRLAGNEIVRDALERAGFDGIIDRTVNKKFGSEKRLGKPMEGMKPNTVHYIIFSPHQVKSAIGNSGAFSRASTDITARNQNNDNRQQAAA
jgi:hypothetical protein